MIINNFLRPRPQLTELNKLSLLINQDLNLLPQNKSISKWVKNFTEIKHRTLKKSLQTLSIAETVYGWELSPSICHFLASRHQTYYSLSVSPIRFMDDYQFLIYTNTHLQLPTLNEFITHLQNTYDIGKHLGRKKFQPPSKIIFEQLPLDAASIQNETLLGLDNVYQYFKLASQDVCLKMHPHSKRQSRNEISGLSAYELLSGNEYTKFFAVSSSLYYEAKVLTPNNMINIMSDYYSHFNHGDLFIANASEFSALFGCKINSVAEYIGVNWT